MANHVKYPWAKWLNPSNKKPVKIIKGRDYNIMTHSMIAYIRSNAAKRGIRVSLYVDENSNITITPNGAVPTKTAPSSRKSRRQPNKKPISQKTHKEEPVDAESQEN